MSRKIFVQSIPRESVLGISEWTSETSGVKLNKTKVGRANTRIMALHNPRVGGLANYISYTPYTDPTTGLEQKDERGNTIMLQQHLEQKWGLPKDYLHNRPHRKDSSLKPEDMSYYQTKYWILQDGSSVLDMNNMDDELGYYVMLASQLIANSEREWKAHKWPKAQFYISLENEGENIKYQKNQIKGKAIASLHAPHMVPTTKRKLVSLLELANTKSNLTNEQVDNLLFDYLDKSAFTPGSNIDKFNTAASLLNTAKGKEEFEARHIIKQAIDSKVIYEKQGSYIWVKPDGNTLNVADRLSEMIDFILSPKKSKEVEEIQEQIKSKQ